MRRLTFDERVDEQERESGLPQTHNDIKKLMEFWVDVWNL